MKKYVMMGVFLFLICCPMTVCGQEEMGEEQEQDAYSMDDIYETSGEMLKSLDVDKIDEILQEAQMPLELSFGEVVMMMIKQESTSGEEIGTIVMTYAFREFIANKNYMIQILLMAIGFALLKNFAEVFEKSYISNICFLLIYCLLMVLLMKSLLVLNEVVEDTIQTVMDFMTAFIPVFSTTLVFSNGGSTAAGFYQLAFLIVYVMQWILGYLLVPAVRVYVVFGFMNHVLENGRFNKMTELIETIIQWILRMITSVVLGLNVIKAAMAPLTDSLTRTTLRRSLAMIPGIGNVLGAASDLFLTTGSIIKNGVGLAALILLLAICMIPLIKIIVMTLMYKLMAAVLEPVCDRRIGDALGVVSKGSTLFFRILGTCIILIFLTVAMTTLLGQNI